MFSQLILASTLLLASQAPSSWVVLVKTDGSVPASWNQNLQDAVKSAAERGVLRDQHHRSCAEQVGDPAKAARAWSDAGFDDSVLYSPGLFK